VPAEPPLAPGQVRVRARRVEISEAAGLVLFYGDVQIITTEVEIKASEATYDRNTELFLARGNVAIRAEDGNTYWGNLLELNVRTRRWRFIDWTVEYPPEFLGPPFIAPVFLNGRDVTGEPGFLRAREASVTTCDLPNPHYVLVAERVDIFPGDKLIARNVDLYVLDNRILRLPWFFLSLRQRRSPIVPEFGQNEYEGYYARFLYQYVLNPDQLGGIRWDQTEKLGAGFGINHFYTIPNGAGEAFLYGRQGLSEYVARVDHTQRLPANVVLDFKGDVREDSLFSLQPTTLTNITTTFRRNTQRSSSLLNYTRRVTEGNFSVNNTSTNLRYNQSTRRSSLQFSSEYSSFGRTGAGVETKDQRWWNRLQTRRDLGFTTANLRVDERVDFGDNINQRFSGVERLPEVYLETNQNQLRWDLLRFLPSTFQLGWGNFIEYPRDLSLNRYLFSWRATPYPIVLGRNTLTPSVFFRQTAYGDEDNTALYSYNANLQVRTNLGQVTNTVNYTFQKSNGFTPFTFDFIYPYETITDNIQLTTTTPWPSQYYLSTGLDLDQDRWQDLSFRADIRFHPDWTTRQSLAYDLNNGRWRDLVSEFTWNNPLVAYSLGSRYDTEEGRLRRVSSDLKWVISPVWRLQWLNGYDGINNKLLYNEFLVTRDLHCWDVSAYYSYQRKYFYLYFRLKALNVPLPLFGIGRGGQVLSTTQGMPF
jgi:lipopolysaccharide assembly outer membrane protein LptD (OstA)